MDDNSQLRFTCRLIHLLALFYWPLAINTTAAPERIARSDGDVDWVEKQDGSPFTTFRRELHNSGSTDREVRMIEFVHEVRLTGPVKDYRTLGVDGLKGADSPASSYLFLAIAKPDASVGTVAGWLTQKRGSGSVHCQPRENGLSITGRLEFGRLRIKPGQTVVTDAFVVGAFADARLGLETYADAIAKANEIKLPKIPNGFCTWYSQPHGGAADEKAMKELGAFCAKELTKFGFDTILIDDQWQGPAIAKGGIMATGPTGNFTRHDPNGPYPSGMKANANQLAAQGIRPGLWFTPFSWDPRDPLFKEHQDWFVKKPDRSLYEVLWAGWCLDMTHPDARAFLADSVRRLTHDWGYSYLKPDAMWCGLAAKCTYPGTAYVEEGFGDAVFHDPNMTNIDAYRAGIRTMREAAGPNTYIAACNVAQNFRSMGGAMGLVDAMRIGPDTGADWGAILPNFHLGSRLYFLHNRVWHNDPDCLMLREPLTLTQARSFASWIAVTGSLNLISEWLPGLPAERLDCLKRSIPNTGLCGRPLDLFENMPARVWQLSDGKRQVVGLFNWDAGKTATATAKLDRLGFKETDGEFIGLDYWSGKLVPIHHGVVSAELPPSGCSVIAVARTLNRPQLLGTSRHITHCFVDVGEDRWDDSQLSGTCRLVGGDPTELRIATSSTAGAWEAVAATVSKADQEAGVTVSMKEEAGLLRITLGAAANREVNWSVRFEKCTPQGKAASLRSEGALLDFDLHTGCYSLSVPPSAPAAVSGAHVTIENWKSPDAIYQRRVVEQSGHRMRIECVGAGVPSLLLEFILHPAFVELRAGLKNTTAEPIRIKKYEPLSGGILFPGGEWTDVRTLNSPSGAGQTQVTRDALRSSANNLLLTFKQDGIRRSLVMGGLKTVDFTKWAHVRAGHKAAVEGYDPVGKLIEPGETYMPADSFYVDAGTANPFESLDRYGLALRAATGANPNPYDFPTVCAWYAGVWRTRGAQDHPEKSTDKINTSAGMVEESRKIKDSGFLNYSRAAGRLVPDNYTLQNPQGWWDDAHWQQHGFYTAPYETSAKFGAGMHDRGTLAFTYVQPVIQPPKWGKRISLDFRESHRDWLLNKDVDMGGLDYSLPAVQEYVRSRFGALRGHIDGLMVDYCDDLWMMTMRGHDAGERLGRTRWEQIPADVGRVEFADKHMTATAFYRTFFRCVKDGLGPNSWLHERLLCQPDNDLLLGIADSQRTEHDSNQISPDLVSRSGLRWYKNRVVLAYDMDSKELTSAWKIKGWTGSDKDGRRMMLTMAYVAASRLLLANSFRNLDVETLHDLERTFPYPTEPRSARPVDAFVHDGWPRVYDFAVTPDWHQVTLFNNALPTREESISVPLAGDMADGALGLDPGAEYHVFDFWNDSYVGTVKGSGILTQTLRPGEARMLSVRKVQDHPQVVSSNRHIMQGHLDLSDVKWEDNSLRGKAKVVGGDTTRIVIALNGGTPVAATGVNISADGKLATLALDSNKSESVQWRVRFK